MKIGILGGGLTALTLGNRLKSDFTILEQETKCGGLCRSLQEDGFTFDCGGSHIIFTKDQGAMDFMLRALGNNKVKNRRNAKTLYKGRYAKYPFENGLSYLSPQDNYECLSAFMKVMIQSECHTPASPGNFKEWCYATFGDGIANKYLIPYNEKIWKYKTELMNVEWIKDRVPQPPMEDVIKSAVGVETEGYTHQLYYYYPEIGGIQALPDSLAENISSKIKTNFAIRSVTKDRSGAWNVSDGNAVEKFDRIVSTLPVIDLATMLEDVPQTVMDAINGLKFNRLEVVMIGVDVPELNDFTSVYIPDEAIMTHRVSFPSNFSPAAAPRGKSSILAEITCSQNDDGVWTMNDADLAESVINQLHGLGILDSKKVCYRRVIRSKYAYIIYDLDYQRNVDLIHDYFKEIGVTLLGRFAEYSYLNMDAVIRHAMTCAEELNRDAA